MSATTHDHAHLRDHAVNPARITVEQPSWREELLWFLVTVLAIAILYTWGHLEVARREAMAAAGEASMWRELALAPESRPTIRLTADGAGWTCEQFQVRREWERAIDKQCQVLGGLLTVARAAP